MGGQYKNNKNKVDGELEGLTHLSRIINNLNAYKGTETLYLQVKDLYDLMLDILEDNHLAEKISKIIKSDASTVTNRIENIIDTLLFNSKKDPFISLGLPQNIDKVIIKDRWKRLITLFHPDRYQNESIYEERSKRINEAYREITLFKKRQHSETNNYHSFDPNRWKHYWQSTHTRHSPKGSDTFNSQNLFKYVPSIIITFAISVSIITVSIFVYKIKRNSDSVSQIVIDTPSKKITLPVENKPNEISKKNDNKEIKKDKRINEDLNITDLETFSLESFEKEVSVRSLSRDNTTKPTFKKPIKDTYFFETFVKSSSKTEKAKDLQVHRPPDKDFNDAAMGNKELKKQHFRDVKTALDKEKPTEVKTAMLPKTSQEKKEISHKEIHYNKTDLKTTESRAFSEEEIIDEINHTISRFVAYYEDGNLKEYLSLFSADAIENGEPVEKLIDTYRKAFDDVKNKLILKNIFIRINNKDNVLVSADYSLNRFDIKNIEYIRFEGKMQWEFKKEGKRFLIKKLHYDRN